MKLAYLLVITLICFAWKIVTLEQYWQLFKFCNDIRGIDVGVFVDPNVVAVVLVVDVVVGVDVLDVDVGVVVVVDVDVDVGVVVNVVVVVVVVVVIVVVFNGVVGVVDVEVIGTGIHSEYSQSSGLVLQGSL